MPSLKVHFNGETRRTQVQEDVTYDGLLQSIISLFPGLDESSAPTLRLFYRDTDGDIITLSSDEEVTTAIAEIPSGGVWRLTARLVKPPSSSSSGSGNQTHPLLDLFEALVNPLQSVLDKEENKTGEESEKKEGEEEETKQEETTTEGEGASPNEEGVTAEGSETVKEDETKEEKVKSKPKTGSGPVWTTYEIRMGPSHNKYCQCHRRLLRPQPSLFSLNLF
uniref:PB1 domain-containing protein n=1 Tax=Amphimedon queenslandica TaxID=400682 RepID=A0A1X7TP14_AMPQE